MDKEEKEVKRYKHLCVKTCFRGGIRYDADQGDILESTDPRAPKHFKGYDPAKDPDAVAKQAPDKQLPLTKE